MKKSIFWVLGLLFSVSFAVSSCEETEGVVDPYFNWEERNQLYIDSIARVAQANLGDEVGQWKMILSYKQTPPNLNGSDKDANDYVYCKILEKGTGTVMPLFTDTAGVHYRGKLIPLYDGSEFVFDQSFQGELNVNVAIPFYSPSVDASGNVSDLGEGMKTATMQMVEGDRWEVYVPYKLGYGTYGTSSIPGYSTLIFDWYLEDIILFR